MENIYPRSKLSKNDVLFKWVKSEAPNIALIHTYKIFQWDLYAIGYKYAADIAVENGLRDMNLHDEKYHCGFFTSDVLVWPVIFLYRQYLELRLKSIIIRGNMLKTAENEYKIPDEMQMEFPATHDIEILWMKCKSILEKYLDDLTELYVMDKHIHEYSKLDDKSFKFRYPVAKKENMPWNFDKRQISLNNLSKVMNDIYDFLEEINSNFDCELQYEEECLIEWLSFQDHCR